MILMGQGRNRCSLLMFCTDGKDLRCDQFGIMMCFSMNIFCIGTRCETWWCRECFFYRPSCAEAFNQRMSVHAEFYGPIFCAHGFTIEGNHDRTAPIAGLGLSRPPCGVLFGISLVIIQSLKRVVWCWTRPHVFIERGKRLLPALTDGYTSTAIEQIAFIVGIGTTLHHRLIDVIFRGSCFPMLGIGKLMTMAYSRQCLRPEQLT